MYSFKNKDIINFNFGDSKCYCMSNGLGGYTSQSIINSAHRKQYGYLVASLRSPVERVMLLNRINEKIQINDNTIDLESQKYDSYIKEGYKYLEEFSYGYIPTYKYNVDGIKIIKRIAPLYGSNTVGISYEIESNKDAYLYLEPLFNYRDHCEANSIKNLDFKLKEDNNLLVLTPKNNKNVNINFSYSDGELIDNNSSYTDGLYFEYDTSTGDDSLDYAYKPKLIKIRVNKNEIKKISIVCSIESINLDAFEIIKSYENRINTLIEKSEIKDELGQNLVVSADTFICDRKSTGLKTILAGLPWFTDWGRDTMIAFTGLTLVTKRFEEAKQILKSFAIYEKNGLIPNMFPDDGNEPYYNTVDASLWYFYAVYKYLEYTNDYEFIKSDIYPVLKNIIKYYYEGTLFSIHADKDGLIHAGSDLDQVTWMDVRVNEIVVTPRHGKPVEINALWYNALMIIYDLSIKFKDENIWYKTMADKVKLSFNEKFYSEETKCLYDTVDPYDKSIRPNQIWVLSLPFKVLDKDKIKNVFNMVDKHLYNVYGLRSLSSEDPRFIPKYEGELLKRDFAYHMGTTWGFLIGGYLDAYNYINDYSIESIDHINQLVDRFMPHLNDGCLNGVAEIFDGDIASRTRGCYNQAWSIGELLRAYYENVLRKKEE